MNKSDLIDAMAADAGITKAAAKAALESLTENVTFDESFDPVDCTSNGPCKTFNFKYTKEQAEKVVGVARANVIEMKDEVKAVLQALAVKK